MQLSHGESRGVCTHRSFVMGQDRTDISIDEFCDQVGLSRPTWYNLLKRNAAPRFYKVGTRTVISLAAVAEWRAAREFAQSNKRTSRKAGA
jgi:excisionase family DNA binding protein